MTTSGLRVPIFYRFLNLLVLLPDSMSESNFDFIKFIKMFFLGYSTVIISYFPCRDIFKSESSANFHRKIFFKIRLNLDRPEVSFKQKIEDLQQKVIYRIWCKLFTFFLFS
jgi:hypothetical protein